MAAARIRRALAGFVVTAVMLVAGFALADWVATGTGTGFAKARPAANLTTNAAIASESLFPGGTGDVAIRIANPNPYSVRVGRITGNGLITSDKPACDTAGSGVTFKDQAGTWDVPPSTSAAFTLAGAVSMAESSPDACQGATFTIPVALRPSTASPPPEASGCATPADCPGTDTQCQTRICTAGICGMKLVPAGTLVSTVGDTQNVCDGAGGVTAVALTPP